MEKRENEGKYRLGTEESKKEYIQADKLAKKAVARAKWIAYRDVQKLRSVEWSEYSNQNG